MFAERAAKTVADQIIAALRGDSPPPPFDGKGPCYIELGDGAVGKVDADFLSGLRPVAPFYGPSVALARKKAEFAATRRRRWFGPTS